MDLIILMGKPRHLDNDFTAAITFWADNKVFNLNQSSKSQLITGKELLCFERVTLLTLDKQQNQRGGVSRKTEPIKSKLQNDVAKMYWVKVERMVCAINESSRDLRVWTQGHVL